MISRTLILFTLITFILFSKSTLANINFPEGSTVKIVSDGMIVDGLKMRAWDFKSKKNIQYNLKYFKEEWESQSEQYSEVKHNGWDIINAVIDDVIYTAKLRPAGDNLTYGFVATSSDLDSSLNKLNNELTGFPKPSGTQIIREIKSIDGVKKSNTIILSNKQSVLNNLAFYTEYYKRFNWTINKSMFTKNKKQGAFLASNGPSNINIIFNNDRSGTTLITAVRVDVE